MTLIEPQITEFTTFSPTGTTTQQLMSGSLIQVPRGARGTLLGCFGSVIILDKEETGFVRIRLIPSVNTALTQPLALMVIQVGIIGFGSPTQELLAAPHSDFDRVFISPGRGTSILNKGARSNTEVGWGFTILSITATTLTVTLSAVYEWILEWQDSGPTGDWQPDVEEEEMSDDEVAW